MASSLNDVFYLLTWILKTTSSNLLSLFLHRTHLCCSRCWFSYKAGKWSWQRTTPSQVDHYITPGYFSLGYYFMASSIVKMVGFKIHLNPFVFIISYQPSMTLRGIHYIEGYYLQVNLNFPHYYRYRLAVNTGFHFLCKYETILASQLLTSDWDWHQSRSDHLLKASNPL